jgi:hypothetical protein
MVDNDKIQFKRWINYTDLKSATSYNIEQKIPYKDKSMDDHIYTSLLLILYGHKPLYCEYSKATHHAVLRQPEAHTTYLKYHVNIQINITLLLTIEVHVI